MSHAFDTDVKPKQTAVISSKTVLLPSLFPQRGYHIIYDFTALVMQCVTMQSVAACLCIKWNLSAPCGGKYDFLMLSAQ